MSVPLTVVNPDEIHIEDCDLEVSIPAAPPTAPPTLPAASPPASLEKICIKYEHPEHPPPSPASMHPSSSTPQAPRRLLHRVYCCNCKKIVLVTPDKERAWNFFAIFDCKECGKGSKEGQDRGESSALQS
jgi:hypothetical protein